ncbi:protein translocase subunit SecD [Sphingomonas sp. M1-B02]|uniref:protein translocase subunit SecD n=1 Tax=Sphingomonas sp. M1-B02 TaxID=3114300 RepID=UPI00224018CB|nr:protein translocase subunit SecD [Sphingomonas sp. S6-11]UZK68001.1 protein translocase subunit SecD [Sphingomonas sp. S6-11]
MLDFPRWKVWAVILTIVACFALAIPTFVPENIRKTWPSWVPQPVVSLGLDLAGGSYLLLEADTKDVAASRLDSMREQVRSVMRRDPRVEIGDISVQGGQLSFMVRDPSKVDAARERLLEVAGSGAGLTGQRVWDISVVDSTRFVLRPTQAGLEEAINTAMDDAREVVDRRINEFGTKEPTVVRQGDNRIVVQVPGLQDPQGLKKLLGTTAKLEFKLVNDISPQQLQAGNIPPDTQVLPYAEGGGQIAVFRQAIITGDMLVDARQDYDPQDGTPGVTLTLDGVGSRRFAKVTQENSGKPFAIIVDNTVISAPRINEPILGGSARINGGFTVKSANELAVALRSGKLPIALKVVEERTVSAELGQDSINKGVLAGVLGTGALIFFMLITYARFGVYTTAALLVNAVMILGIMALFGAALTLPGIAGFVLTIGAAVDANVLINERIREEQRMRNRNALASVQFGYKEASTAIFDANITNVISAVIMFTFGSGPIRGFAVVLAIGIVTSVFTGVTFTRLLVADWLKRNRPKTISI